MFPDPGRRISLYSGAGSGLKHQYAACRDHYAPYLPVLWCRERIETLTTFYTRQRAVLISLYSGAGSGLKPRGASAQTSCHAISLYSGAGSGLKRRAWGWTV